MDIPHFNATVESTEDGSKTLLHSLFGDNYHSFSGAVAESLHVYIAAGLEYVDELGVKDIRLFEMGFGSGLNALLTLDYAIKNCVNINYFAIELYPLELSVIRAMEFDKIVDNSTYKLFEKILDMEWNVTAKICDYFTITKIYGDILTTELPSELDLIYYDAFAYDTQPQLWSSDIFSKIYESSHAGTVLTTYSSKGKVKEALRDSGFIVKRLPGPNKKRHIIRAYISE